MTTIVRHTNGRGLGVPALLGWDPLRLMNDLMSWEPFGAIASFTFQPVRVDENEDGVVMAIDVPGVEEKDLELTLQGHQLTIEGRRDQSTFRRTVTLGEQLDTGAIAAELKNGVLTVRVPRRPEARPRKIALQGVTGAKQLETGEPSKS